MTHTQEEADAELREKLKQLKFDHTDSTPDGYNSLCDEDIDEIMAAVQAHNARIRSAKVTLSDAERFDYDRLRDLERRGIRQYHEMRNAETLSEDAVLSFINQLSPWNLRTTGASILRTYVERLSPIQPEKGASDEMRKVW